jgi:hypothetical protein
MQEMCLAMGQNPSSQRYVPYNATDFKFNDNWQKLVMKPLEQEGVDFWWLESGNTNNHADIANLTVPFSLVRGTRLVSCVSLVSLVFLQLAAG